MGASRAAQAHRRSSSACRATSSALLRDDLYPINGDESGCCSLVSDDVRIFRDLQARGYAALDKEYSVTVVTGSAVYKPRVVEGRYVDEADRERMRLRIRGLLSGFENADCDVCLLSAFGCGAFGNPGLEVAYLFAEELQHVCLKRVIFCIVSDQNSDGVDLKDMFSRGLLGCGGDGRDCASPGVSISFGNGHDSDDLGVCCRSGEIVCYHMKRTVRAFRDAIESCDTMRGIRGALESAGLAWSVGKCYVLVDVDQYRQAVEHLGDLSGPCRIVVRGDLCKHVEDKIRSFPGRSGVRLRSRVVISDCGGESSGIGDDGGCVGNDIRPIVGTAYNGDFAARPQPASAGETSLRSNLTVVGTAAAGCRNPTAAAGASTAASSAAREAIVAIGDAPCPSTSRTPATRAVRSSARPSASH